MTVSASPTVDAMSRRLQASWDALARTLDGIPAGRLEEAGVVGDWSVKDLLGHLAFWEARAVENVERRAAGLPDLDLDVSAVNDREAAARRDRSAADLRAELARTHERLVTILASTDSSRLVAAAVCDCLRGDPHEHYDEHAAEIRAWRARVGL